jgi:hypothetical protein
VPFICSFGGSFYLNAITDYTVPVSRFNGEKIEVMRIVLRDEMTDELMEEVLTCITQAVDKLIHKA